MELVTRRVIQRLQKEAGMTYSNGQTARSISGVEEGRAGAGAGFGAATDTGGEVRAGAGAGAGGQYSDIKAYINMDSVEHKAMIEGICQEMGFTSLKFSTIQNLIQSIGLPKSAICTYCFDGEGCRE